MKKSETAIRSVLDYHELTKHRLDRYAPGPGYMDWKNQPNPFRFYEGGDKLALHLNREQSSQSYAVLFGSSVIEPAAINLPAVAAFLELSLGLSAWKRYEGSEWSLRMNPSSGNLHPTECHLLLPGYGGIPACIAHYNPLLHCLEIRAELRDSEAESLGRLNGFGLILSSIFWREAWKYGERAFRYTQHDVGHALGSLRFSAALSGWKLSVRPEIGGEFLDRLLGLEKAGSHRGELEHADCFCWVTGGDPREQNVVEWLKALQGPDYQDVPNQLSRSHTEWPLIDQVVKITRSPGFSGRREGVAGSLCSRSSEKNAEPIIRQRRSAQAYDPAASSISYEHFVQILSATLPAEDSPFDALPTTANLHLILFVHQVEGLAPGLYCLVRDARDLDVLQDSFEDEFNWKRVEQDLPLYLLQQDDLRTFAATASCHQAIAGDSAFSLGMLARFEPLVKEAPWLYPCLFWESGMIGQVLYLEAEEKGLRGTGIGCFFDDVMHEILSLEDHGWQDLYHFTIGTPREDTRLQTLPPYHHLPGASKNKSPFP
jgi:SagB-type dehydrogenase family enzyme